ncbi:hypothetical protein K0M31_018630, partial [Melipona bicolor]
MVKGGPRGLLRFDFRLRGGQNFVNSGNEILYRDETGNLLIYNVTSRKPRRILESSNNALMSSFDHQLSADRKYLLLAIDYQKVSYICTTRSNWIFDDGSR